MTLHLSYMAQTLIHCKPHNGANLGVFDFEITVVILSCL